MEIALAFLAVFGSLIFAVIYGRLPARETPVERPPVNVPPTIPPVPSPTVPESVPAPKYDFLTPKAAYHSVRVICDEEGLTYEQKNLICACVYQESRFDNEAVGRNATSIDWGIVQVNDHYHIGPAGAFPSVAYVLDHPDEAVRWMVRMFKVGKLNLWVSYSSGAYQQWLIPTSPMWKLAA